MEGEVWLRFLEFFIYFSYWRNFICWNILYYYYIKCYIYYTYVFTLCRAFTLSRVIGMYTCVLSIHYISHASIYRVLLSGTASRMTSPVEYRLYIYRVHIYHAYIYRALHTHQQYLVHYMRRGASRALSAEKQSSFIGEVNTNMF